MCPDAINQACYVNIVPVIHRQAVEIECVVDVRNDVPLVARPRSSSALRPTKEEKTLRLRRLRCSGTKS